MFSSLCLIAKLIFSYKEVNIHPDVLICPKKNHNKFQIHQYSLRLPLILHNKNPLSLNVRYALHPYISSNIFIITILCATKTPLYKLLLLTFSQCQLYNFLIFSSLIETLGENLTFSLFYLLIKCY